MKKTYTKKQIKEAIAHWQNELAKIGEARHDGIHLPRHQSHRNQSERKTIYYVAVDYNEEISDWGQFVSQNGKLTNDLSNENFKHASRTIDPQKAIIMANDAVQKYGKGEGMYVFLYREAYSYGMQTHKNHARPAPIDIWSPQTQSWRYDLKHIRREIMDESTDFSDASTLKMSCYTNKEYDGTFYKYQVEEEMAGLGMSDVGATWIEFVLNHIFSDDNNWTQELSDAFAKDNVKAMTVVLGNNVVKLEKIH